MDLWPESPILNLLFFVVLKQHRRVSKQLCVSWSSSLFTMIYTHLLSNKVSFLKDINFVFLVGTLELLELCEC